MPMSGPNVVKTVAHSPIGAGATHHALEKISGLPTIVSVSTDYGTALDVYVEFKSEPSTGQITLLHNAMLLVALPARQEAFARRMSDDVHEAIIGGFQSSATGTAYYYDTDEEAQLNMVGASSAFIASEQYSIPFVPVIYWHVRTTVNGAKFPIQHNGPQITQVGLEFMGFKEQILGYYQIKKAEMLAITDADLQNEFEATWNPLAVFA